MAVDESESHLLPGAPLDVVVALVVVAALDLPPPLLKRLPKPLRLAKLRFGITLGSSDIRLLSDGVPSAGTAAVDDVDAVGEAT